MLTINTALLRRTLAHIETNPDRWSQVRWRDGDKLDFAGHACVLDGAQLSDPWPVLTFCPVGFDGERCPFACTQTREVVNRRHTVVVRPERAAEIPGFPTDAYRAWDGRITAPIYEDATWALGLNDQAHANELFCETNTLDDLRTIVGRLTAGRSGTPR
ncbi:hypothetical protein [Streptomyces hydrogenans]|uniref:hypothetical protein n=1 Tax=Streptomyces hydrogenans TaxID=1873719 RepID=UPI0038194315